MQPGRHDPAPSPEIAYVGRQEGAGSVARDYRGAAWSCMKGVAPACGRSQRFPPAQRACALAEGWGGLTACGHAARPVRTLATPTLELVDALHDDPTGTVTA